MPYHIVRVGLERLKLPKMASITSCQLLLPRILPQLIISQVLGPCILNCESPKDVTNPFQGFKNFLDHVYCSFKTCIDSLFIYKASIILVVPSVIYLFLFLQFKLYFK